MYTPLVISRQYFIKNSPGGQIERVFWNNIQNRDFTPIICSTNRGDKQLIASDVNRKIITPELFSLKYVDALLRRVGLGDLTFLPDSYYYTWGTLAKKIIKNKQLDFDYIHSTSFACSNHLIALDIKKRTGKPWVAYFFDPWHDNPYREFKFNFFRKRDLEEERRIAENADIILHVNEKMYDIWLSRYGDLVKDKMYVLPLIISYEEEYTPISLQKEYVTISHIGTFFLNRNSKNFIKAVSEAVLENPDVKNRLRINYVGLVSQAEKDLICNWGLTDMFNLVGTISEEECIKYYIESDAFLAVDGKNEKNIFFPSKIMKYFYYKRPILGITPSDSVLSSELKLSGHVAIDNDNLEELKKYILRLVYNYESLDQYDKTYWHKFSKENVYNRYVEILSEKHILNTHT